MDCSKSALLLGCCYGQSNVVLVRRCLPGLTLHFGAAGDGVEEATCRWFPAVRALLETEVVVGLLQLPAGGEAVGRVGHSGSRRAFEGTTPRAGSQRGKKEIKRSHPHCKLWYFD